MSYQLITISSALNLLTQGRQVSVMAPNLSLLTYQCPSLTASIETGWVSQKYGVKQPAPVSTLKQTDSASLFFCTVVTPRAAEAFQKESVEIQSLDLLNQPTDSILLFQVSGRAEGQAFCDRFYFARNGQSGSFQGLGLTLEGRGVGFRQTAGGEVTYLFSQQATQIEIEDQRLLTSYTAQSIECPDL